MSQNIKYSLQDIINIDQYLMQLAAYETSGGMMSLATSIDETIEIQKGIAKQFNFFKRMIQNNECSLEELEQMVLTRHGAIPNANHHLGMEDALEKFAKTPDEQIDINKETIDAVKFIMDSLNLALSSPQDIDIEPPIGSSAFDMTQEELENMNLESGIKTQDKNEKPIKPRSRKSNGQNGNTRKKNRSVKADSESKTDN